MDAPLGIIFLKKAELYNLVKRLDEQSALDKKNENKEKNENKAPNTWPVERNILEWTYLHHKHLGTPITAEFFEIDDDNSKLKDCGLADKNGIKTEFQKVLASNQNHKIRQNMVIRGFADFYINPANSIK